jgi:dynein heavy chain
VLLQNCHVAASWLPTLDKIVAAAAAAAAGGGSGPRPHGNYRLWLTAFPTASFPVGVLQVRAVGRCARGAGSA